jgi:ATP-dependent helicase HrpA
VSRMSSHRVAPLAPLPQPAFSGDLPIHAELAALQAAIREHQVVVVCGETGSGKSTQLPRICLSIGRGLTARIGHTQPRRLAARTLAARIAEELGVTLGTAVGYKIRFSDQVSAQTRVKLLTDGMLLAETRSDPLLREYDTLLIDEAHERSLNIDFLLGYLKRLLPRRPDLKLIITSATIDTARFAAHFDGAPVFEVGGRGYPVELRYRPVVGELQADVVSSRDRQLLPAIAEAVRELSHDGPGDILVFLPTERDIREAAEAVAGLQLPHTTVLPLFARLSTREQQRVFAPHPGRRVVLSTNVAETSVTVPGIHYVVDTGLVRISRYSPRSKLQRLPVEPISQASAAQRAGRCGRVAPGICIRLYAEDDLLARPSFTDPEIRRCNLAAVILQMAAQALGEFDAFPFIELPDRRQVNDGYRLLFELGAMDEQRRITGLGRRLARLPVDPVIARMLVEASQLGVLDEVLVIAAGLSVPDPRDRPLDGREAADEAHAAWQHPDSDFLGLLALWRGYREQATRLGRSALRRWAQEQFLALSRLRDWEDIHRQLRELCHEIGLRSGVEPGSPRLIHRALLSGLLGGVARHEEDAGGDYIGVRGLRMRIFPGSTLARRRPPWIIAAELVETSRVYARMVARVRPDDIERQARHLLRRSYTDIHWDRRRGEVQARERVSLYGLLLAADRLVDYGRVDPVTAREVFLRQGLVEDAVDTAGTFAGRNRALLAAIHDLEARARRRDLVTDQEGLYAFFDARVPADVCDRRRFEAWRVKVEATDPDCLVFDRSDLLRADATPVTVADYPDSLACAGMQLPLGYRFDPGEEDDGVTVTVPVSVLGRLAAADFEALVPGLLQEKLLCLIRGLPKRLRRHLVPAPDHARRAAVALAGHTGSLLEGLRGVLHELSGVDVSPEHWLAVDVPAHLLMRFRVIDEEGRELAAARDLPALQRRYAARGGAAAAVAADSASDWSGGRYTRWDVGAIPPPQQVHRHGIGLQLCPALADRGDHVTRVAVNSTAEAEESTRAAVCRLLRIALRQQLQVLDRRYRADQALQLACASVGGSQALREALIQAVLDRVFPAEPAVTDGAAFQALLDRGRARVIGVGEELIERVATALQAQRALRRGIAALGSEVDPESVTDLAEHLDSLVYPGFVADLPAPVFEQLPRYLKGLEMRIDKLRADPRRDLERAREARGWTLRYRQRLTLKRERGSVDADLIEFRELIEEYRISLFAQALGTRVPVSAKRLEARWQTLR